MSCGNCTEVFCNAFAPVSQVKIYKNYGFYGNTEIICAAVRTPKQIVDCARAGADIVTAGLDVYKDSMKHAYTTQGIGTFTNAWDNTVTE